MEEEAAAAAAAAWEDPLAHMNLLQVMIPGLLHLQVPSVMFVCCMCWGVCVSVRAHGSMCVREGRSC